MAETKWTEGEWRVAGRLGAGILIDAPTGGGAIAVVYGPSMTPEGDANAHLLANSKKLYRALETARIYVEEYINANGGIDGCEHQDRVSLERIDAALSAARGGSDV